MGILFEDEKGFASALGELCMMVSGSENHIRRFIHSLLSNEDRKLSEFMTSEMHFSNLCSLLGVLYDYREQRRDKSKSLKELMRRFRKAYADRDELIHSEWYVLSLRTAKRVRRFKSTNIDISEIHKVTEQFRKMNSELTTFLYDWQGEHPSKQFLDFLGSLLSPPAVSMPKGSLTASDIQRLRARLHKQSKDKNSSNGG